MKSKITKRGILNIAAVTLLCSVLRAVSIHCFINPFMFAPGGVTGLSSIMQHLTGLSAGVWLFAFNVPLLIVAWRFIGRRFAVITGGGIVCSSLLMLLLEAVDFYTFEGGEPILAAVAGGLTFGVALALMLRIEGSTGGTDIIAVLIQRRYKSTNVAWFIFMLDALVVIGSIFAFKDGLTPVLLAFAEMFAASKVSEAIEDGMRSAIKMEIITEDPDTLSKEIIEELQRGVTKIESVGMFTQNPNSLLICVIRKRQLAKFYSILKKYPHTFAYALPASEVLGRGFTG